MSKLVSVVIPAFNAEKYIAESIESVLNQTYKHIEIIVVDDGSTDKTNVIAQSYPVTVILQENQGGAAAMNTGIQAATGYYLASNDADDIWLSQKLELQMQVLSQQEDIDIVFGHMEQFISPDIDTSREHGILQEDKKILPAYASPTMLIKRHAFDKVGLFDETYTIGDFVEWYTRAKAQNLKPFMLDDVLVKRRIHNTNTGLIKKGAQSDYLKILKAALDRKRANRDNPK